jgi:hypothetical protein
MIWWQWLLAPGIESGRSSGITGQTVIGGVDFAHEGSFFREQ